MLPLLLCSSLLVGPPTELPVQRPGTKSEIPDGGAEPAPTEIEPERGLAPARVEATEAAPQPALGPERDDPDDPTDRDDPVLPSDEPGGGVLPSYEGGAGDGPMGPTGTVGPAPDAAELPGVYAPVEPGTRRRRGRKGGPANGVAFMVFGGTVAAAVNFDQAVTLIICGPESCDRAWITERFLLLGAVGMASGGGYKLGEYLAWDDEEVARVRPMRSKKIAGFTMFGLGLAAMVVDAGFTGACYDNGRGPYVKTEAFAFTCRSGLSAGVQDLATVAAGVGGGFGFAALGYERHRKLGSVSASRTDRAGTSAASFAVLPLVGRGRAGLSLGGQF